MPARPQKLTASHHKNCIGDHEKETHLGLEDPAVATSTELGKGVGNVAGHERPADKAVSMG